MSIAFTVPGRPRPQGSKRGFVNKHSGRVAMVESSKHVGDWRARISHQAGMVGTVYSGRPVAVSIWCVFARPKAHYRTGKNAHLLKDDAPHRPISRSTGDADKLARAVLDGLTGSLIADDSLVCELRVSCSYGEPERVEIKVWELGAFTVAEREAVGVGLE